MTRHVIRYVPNVAVRTNGTFTVAYPTGTTAADYSGSEGHTLIAIQATFDYTNGFTLAFGDALITVTYLGVTTIPANTPILVEVTDTNGDDATANADEQILFAGLTVLRGTYPVSGQRVYLSFHSAVSDLGGGFFRAATGASPGTYVDNDGTIIVPTGGNGSAAWLRDWDGLRAHVGWFGAKCDHAADDLGPLRNALKLFTSGRVGVRSGILDVGPGCNFSAPLYYGGASTQKFKIRGSIGGAYSNSDSYLRYTGPRTFAAIVFYGANQSLLEDVGVLPGLAQNGFLLVADNRVNTTLAAPVTAGQLVEFTPTSMLDIGAATITVGSLLGVGTGSTFEVVYIRKVGASTLFADFQFDHAAGEQVGNSPGSSGCGVRNSSLWCAQSPIVTTIAAGVTGGADRVVTPGSMTNIRVGDELFVGFSSPSEIVRVKDTTATTFTATFLYTHAVNVPLVLACASVAFGNRGAGSVQVSELDFVNLRFLGNVIDSTSSYAGIRQLQGGNVKNVSIINPTYNRFKIPFAFEDGSGSIVIFHPVGSNVSHTLFLQNGGDMLVEGLEDESAGAYMLRGTVGLSSLSAVFISPMFQHQAPADDLVVNGYTGILTIIGGDIKNNRLSTTIPKFKMTGIDDPTTATALTLTGVKLQRVQAGDNFIQNGSGANMLPIAPGTKLMMINCIGGKAGDGTYPQVALTPVLPS